MNIAILKYNAGNVQSVIYALKRLGYTAVVTDDEEEITKADKVIFPGVGHAGAAMASLREKGLDQLIPTLKQPLLGICVGMQLLCNYSEESGEDCLKIVNTRVEKFPESAGLKIPQVGWNSIYNLQGPLMKGIPEHSYVYFVHSYFAGLCEDTVATTDYGLVYSAVVQKDNFFGVQFHTEKSATVGDYILKNFIAL